MTDDSESGGHGYNRRLFLKTTGATAIGAGLAGCGGGDGGGDGGDGGDGGGDVSTPTPRVETVVQTRTVEGDVETVVKTEEVTPEGNNFEGLEINYWNQMNVQSRQARSVSEALANNFEQFTGATVNVNWSGYGDVIGATWRNQFSQGNYPVVYDSVTTWDGQFVEGGWVKPFDEYMDQFSDQLISSIEWIFPTLRNQYRGFEGDDVWEVPFGFLLQLPFVVRMDHLDEAGLSRDRLPPEDYDDLIDIATTLQEDGPGEFGHQIHGTKFDATDCRLPNMAVAEGGQQGLFLNEDWSDTRWDNDVWKKVVRQWVEIFTEHELSSPGTPNHDDEAMVQEISSGRTSMNSGDTQNHPDMLDTMPDLMEAGDVQWVPQWPGDHGGGMGIIQPYGLGITVPPEGADSDEWNRKQQAGIELIKLFLTKDFQRNLFENFGLFPIRDDVWDDFPDSSGSHRLYETATTMAQNSDFAWAAHPQSVSVQYNVPAPHIQEALNGNKSPEQACDDIAADVREQLL